MLGAMNQVGPTGWTCRAQEPGASPPSTRTAPRNGVQVFRAGCSTMEVRRSNPRGLLLRRTFVNAVDLRLLKWNLGPQRVERRLKLRAGLEGEGIRPEDLGAAVLLND